MTTVRPFTCDDLFTYNDVNTDVFTETFNLPAGSTTQLIANGVLDPTMFEANPDGESTAFQLLVGADAQAAGRGGKTSVRVVHGATDAPTVDVRSGGAILVDDAAYTAITGYLRLPAASYTLDITTAEGSAARDEKRILRMHRYLRVSSGSAASRT